MKSKLLSFEKTYALYSLVFFALLVAISFSQRAPVMAIGEKMSEEISKFAAWQPIFEAIFNQFLLCMPMIMAAEAFIIVGLARTPFYAAAHIEMSYKASALAVFSALSAWMLAFTLAHGSWYLESHQSKGPLLSADVILYAMIFVVPVGAASLLIHYGFEGFRLKLKAAGMFVATTAFGTIATYSIVFLLGWQW